MPSIKILPDNLINKIAAGEVVERPASVVKELIENAVDAGATEVLVDVEQAGKRLIRIADNGSGMEREDARLAFERHATSKLGVESELDAIRTMGFRGEALSSIASVARVRLLTGVRGRSAGTLVEIEGGAVRTVEDAAASAGTSIEVRHLFFNTPARLKFLKSPATELAHITAAVQHQAVARPGMRFRLTHDGKTVLDLPPAVSLRERAFQVFGADLTENLIDLSAQREPLRLTGLISRPNYSRGDRTFQEFYVNGRFVRNAALGHALYQAYADLLMRDRHPAAVLFLELDPALVDVNVHPAKTEVRFRSQSQVHDLLRDAVRETLRGPAQPAGAGLEPRLEGVQETARGYLASPPAGSAGPRERFDPHAFRRRRSDQAPVLPVHDSGFAAPAQEPLPVFAAEVLVPLAQVHDSFIVAQYGGGMALIDQHAAHERVLFERLLDQQANGAVQVQDLLIPFPVDVRPAERELLTEHLPVLRDFGFHVEPFGGGTFVIKAAPALLSGGDYPQLLRDILDELTVHGRSGKLEVLRNEVLAVMACHPAIKVHRRLSLREMEDLIRDLFECRMPHSCPHGRPTVVRFTLTEIRKMFKRI